MGLNRNINDDSTLAYLFNKTRQGASDALQKAIDAINATIASIQTALNNKASKNGSDITNASTWRSNIGAVDKAGDTMTGNLEIDKSNPSVFLKDTVADTSLSSDTTDRVWTFGARDKNDKYAAYWQSTFQTNGRINLVMSTRRIVGGSNVDNAINLRINNDGTRIVSLSDSAPWRSALGLGTSGELPITIAQGGTGQTAVTSVTTASSIVTAASGITVSSAAYYQWGKVAQLRVQFKKTTAQTTDGTITLGTLVSGKRPINLAPATCNLQSLQTSYISSAGVIYVYGTVSANTEFGVVATYILP